MKFLVCMLFLIGLISSNFSCKAAGDEEQGLLLRGVAKGYDTATMTGEINPFKSAGVPMFDVVVSIKEGTEREGLFDRAQHVKRENLAATQYDPVGDIKDSLPLFRESAHMGHIGALIETGNMYRRLAIATPKVSRAEILINNGVDPMTCCIAFKVCSLTYNFGKDASILSFNRSLGYYHKAFELSTAPLEKAEITAKIRALYTDVTTKMNETNQEVRSYSNAISMARCSSISFMSIPVIIFIVVATTGAFS